MEVQYSDCKFFRFRSAVGVGTSEPWSVDHIVKSLDYLDFNYAVLISEAVQISILTKGGFSFDIMKEMEFDQYENLIKECQQIAKEQDKE